MPAEQRRRNGTSPRCIDCGRPSDLALNPSGLWCHDCEIERRERITVQMAAITRSFEQPDPGDCRECVDRGLM
jgi:hypothetical protein